MKLIQDLLKLLFTIHATMAAMIIHANKNMFRYLGVSNYPVDLAMAGLAASAALEPDPDPAGIEPALVVGRVHGHTGGRARHIRRPVRRPAPCAAPPA